MYEEIFRSQSRPFKATPDVDFYYPSPSSEEARQAAVRAVERASGPVAILGGAGLGKSLLGEVIADDLCSYFDIVKLHAAKLCSRKALLQNVLFELELPYKDLSEGELRLAILDRLEEADGRAPGGLAIIVDEAHTLPAKLLEELRLISNFTRNNQPRARLVLLGGMRLEDTFASPELESFNQRLAARCYLTPMNRSDIQRFVQHQIQVAGLDASQFITPDGLEAVYAASEGVPRIANQVMDQAIVLAATQGQSPIDSGLIEEAWSDLQQLPVPWQLLATQNDSKSEGGTEIEFGTLDDEPNESALEPLAQTEQTLATQPTEESDVNSLNPTFNEVRAESAEVVVEETVDLYEAVEEQPVAGFSVEFGALEPDSISVDEATLAPELNATETQEYSEQPNSEILDAIEQNNFFAAFTEPAAGELPATVQEQLDYNIESDDCDEVVEAAESVELDLVDDVNDSNELVVNLKDHDLSDPDIVAPGKVVSAEVFFSSKPTDEKLLAYEAEASEFESMGVWENDPPLANPNEIQIALEAVESSEFVTHESETPQIESREAQNQKPANAEIPTDANSLFGNDFDEELSLNQLNEIQERRQIAAIFDDPAVSEEVLEPEITTQPEDIRRVASRLDALTASDAEKFVDSAEEQGAAHVQPTAANTDEPVEASIVDSQRLEADAKDNSLSVDVDVPTKIQTSDIAQVDYSLQAEDEPYTAAPWMLSVSTEDVSTIDVTPVDVSRELELQNEIQDLVEQLNFSGVDSPGVIEQLEIDQNSSSNSTAPEPPEDSVRRGQDDQVYTMHSPKESSEGRELFADLTEPIDDDRDMLIVEEDVPLQQPATGPKPTSSTKTVPYGQLFSQLRQ